MAKAKIEYNGKCLRKTLSVTYALAHCLLTQKFLQQKPQQINDMSSSFDRNQL